MVAQAGSYSLYNARTISIETVKATYSRTSSQSEGTKQDKASETAYTLDIEFSSLKATSTTTLTTALPKGNYTLLNRLRDEGRLEELTQTYDLVDHLKKNGTLINLGTHQGIQQFLDETVALQKSFLNSI